MQANDLMRNDSFQHWPPKAIFRDSFCCLLMNCCVLLRLKMFHPPLMLFRVPWANCLHPNYPNCPKQKRMCCYAVPLVLHFFYVPRAFPRSSFFASSNMLFFLPPVRT